MITFRNDGKKMKFENEITVEVNCDFEDLEKQLLNIGFELKEKYLLKDIYMINSNYEITDDYLDALKNCVLIRNIIESDKETKLITYKYKEYNVKKEIIKQGKVDCEIKSIESAKALLEAINYKELIHINDEIYVYDNDKTQFAVQLVNDKHIYIEMEDEDNFTNRKYNNVNEMIDELKSYNLPIKEDNYFVKKAEIELIESMKGD